MGKELELVAGTLVAMDVLDMGLLIAVEEAPLDGKKALENGADEVTVLELTAADEVREIPLCDVEIGLEEEIRKIVVLELEEDSDDVEGAKIWAVDVNMDEDADEIAILEPVVDTVDEIELCGVEAGLDGGSEGTNVLATADEDVVELGLPVAEEGIADDAMALEREEGIGGLELGKVSDVEVCMLLLVPGLSMLDKRFDDGDDIDDAVDVEVCMLLLVPELNVLDKRFDDGDDVDDAVDTNELLDDKGE